MVWLVLSLNRLVCLAHGDPSPGGRASAFALEPLLQASVVVGFRSHLLAGGELGVVLWRGDGGQIALAQIDADHLRQGGWRGVRGVDGQRHQEREAALGAVIPEFGAADLGPVLEPGHVTTIALRGKDHSPGERQHTHPPLGFEGVVAPQNIAERGRDRVRRLVQAPERASWSSRLGAPPRSCTTWSTAPCRWRPPGGRHCTPSARAGHAWRGSRRRARGASAGSFEVLPCAKACWLA